MLNQQLICLASKVQLLQTKDFWVHVLDVLQHLLLSVHIYQVFSSYAWILSMLSVHVNLRQNVVGHYSQKLILVFWNH